MRVTPLLVSIFLCCGSFAAAQDNLPVFEFAKAENRLTEKQKLMRLADSVVQLPLNARTTGAWAGAGWAMEIMLYRPAGYEARIPQLLSKWSSYDAYTQWHFLQQIATLFPGKFGKEVRDIWTSCKTDKIKALAAVYLHRSRIKIPVSSADPFFQTAYGQRVQEYIRQRTSGIKEQDLLRPDFLPGEYLLVSIQHADRNIPGYLQIRTPQHQWLSDAGGRPYRFMQLARSITNMPYFLTNGNTPQGLFRLNGFDSSSNNWIGPTTNLQMVMPFEQEVRTAFFPDSVKGKEREFYVGLLGPLAGREALWESYRAGELGRSEIIAHGTTIPEYFYQGQPYFPCTPSLGCLCSPEIWDQNGKRVSSVQEQWIQLVKQLPVPITYLLVIDL